MTKTQFLIEHPELVAADLKFPSLIQATLDAAALDIDPEIWGPLSTVAPWTKADQGHAYLALHLLACSPMATGMKLAAKDGSSTYYVNYMRLLRQVAGPAALLL